MDLGLKGKVAVAAASKGLGRATATQLAAEGARVVISSREEETLAKTTSEIVEGTSDLIVGDRNYHSPETREELATMGIELVAPYSSKKRDPAPKQSALLSRLRYRIGTVFSQLTERYSIKRVWARDLWHLASRVLRKVFSHTIDSLLNHQLGNRPLQLSKLLI
jgi:NAD(P)-dependent dehydrogenase (short-subunit alcohol dehydrogenase family)